MNGSRLQVFSQSQIVGYLDGLSGGVLARRAAKAERRAALGKAAYKAERKQATATVKGLLQNRPTPRTA